LRAIQQECWSDSNDTLRLVDQLMVTIADSAGWAREAINEPVDMKSVGLQSDVPQPYFDPRELITPGGAIEIDSKFYISREDDAKVLDEVQHSRAIVTVLGPRQTGKTSLIFRVLTARQKKLNPFRTAFIDLQACPYDSFGSLDSIWRAIADHIADQLQLENLNSTSWDPGYGYDRNISHFISHHVLAKDETPLLICLDEVDRLFRFSVSSQFFSSIRAFYNRGAIDKNWRKVRWILGTSTEPHFFIDNLSESPFNIGLRIRLQHFQAAEVRKLAERYGIQVEKSLIDRIMTYLGGQPYLVNLLLFNIVRYPAELDQFFDVQSSGKGIFRDHLHRFLIQFQQEKILFEAMKDISNGGEYKDIKVLSRLEAAGLVVRDHEKLVPSCQLYAHFFRAELN